MQAKEIEKIAQAVAEIPDKPVSCAEAARRLKISAPAFCKYVHILAAQGRVRLKRVGNTLLIQ